MKSSIAELLSFKEKVKTHYYHLYDDDQSKTIWSLASKKSTKSLFSFLHDIDNCKSLTDIQFYCYHLAKKFDFQNFQISLSVPLDSKHYDQHIIQGKANVITQYYNEKKLIYIDPFVAHSLKHSIPLFWTQLKDRIESFKHFSSQYAQYLDIFKVSCVIIVPWHHSDGKIGCLKFEGVSPQVIANSDLEDALPIISLLTLHIFEKLICFESFKPTIENIASLTPRELDILTWFAVGKSSMEVSDILHISLNTIFTHTKNIYRKLNVCNRQHAISKAIHLNLISI